MGFYLDIILEVFTFAVVIAIVWAGSRMVMEAWAVRRRLAAQSASAPVSVSGSSVVKRQSVGNPILRWVQASTSLNNPEDAGKLRRDLSHGGFESPSAPVIYVIARFSLAIGLPLAFLLAQNLLAKPMGGVMLIGGALGLTAMGLYMPRFYLDHVISARKEKMEQEFPDALDLMVVCVEAGLGLESAFIRVSYEVHESHARIAEEFDRVSQEFRAGRARADALRNMGDRTDVPSVKAFTALLIQTDTLGTSIGQTLRTYSVEMRAHRFLKAEEKAMRIPVLMTVPLVACILPVIVTALLLPPILDVMRTLGPAFGGGH